MMTAHRNSGFTLLEISIVLVLIGVVTAGGLVILGSSLQKGQNDATVAKMQVIEKALLNYRIAFNRLPCPGGLTILPPTPSTSSIDYGQEAGVDTANAVGAGECKNSITPQADFEANSVAEGAVPTRALQLPDSFMYDGWGRRFRYAVDITMTKTGSFVTYPVKPTSCPPHGAITVEDYTLASITTKAIYLLLSHGANGHGAYTQSGANINANLAALNTPELTNCHCTTAGAPGVYLPTYVQQIPSYLTGHAGDATYFADDIVTFKERFQMLAPNEPSASPTCP